MENNKAIMKYIIMYLKLDYQKMVIICINIDFMNLLLLLL